MKQNTATKKLVLAGVLTALAVVGSLISFPIAGSKCAPVQHMVNILAAVALGPGWGVGIAFTASLLRNILGLGAFWHFPAAWWEPSAADWSMRDAGSWPRPVWQRPLGQASWADFAPTRQPNS